MKNIIVKSMTVLPLLMVTLCGERQKQIFVPRRPRDFPSIHTRNKDVYSLKRFYTENHDFIN
ncbi:hypothetical protein B1B01_23360 [Priestia filamentosa]|nr:hypothetical protein B1B01_23360 [Priestia filamentosa]